MMINLTTFLSMALLGSLLGAFPNPPVDDGVDDLVRDLITSERLALEKEALPRPRSEPWENAWIIPSEHYMVRATSSRLFCHVAGQRLDTMWIKFRDYLDASPPVGTFLNIDVYPGLVDYQRIGNTASTNADAYHSSTYGSFYFSGDTRRPVVSYDAGYNDRSFQWLTLAAFHQFYSYAELRPLPTWIMEGLASYFSLHFDFDRSYETFARLKSRSLYLTLEQLQRANLNDYRHETYLQVGMAIYFLNDLFEETRMTFGEGGEILKAPLRDFVRKQTRGRSLIGDPVHSLLSKEGTRLEAAYREQFKI